MELRPATAADFEAEHEVLLEAEGGLRERHGFPWAAPPPIEAFAAAHAHILETDPGRSWVAEERGRVVGYTAAWVRGDTWFLSDLFVHPEAQGRGVGPALLERAWGDPPPRRITLTDAIQPISNAMYARRGLIPAVPVLELGGRAHAAREPELEPVAPTPAALAELDAATYGFDRGADHAFWSRSAPCTLWLDGGVPVAYSYTSGSGRVGPVAGRDGAAAAHALEAALAALGKTPARLDIPGSSRDLVAVALGAGLRITGPPGLLLLSAGVPPPRALALHGYWLL